MNNNTAKPSLPANFMRNIIAEDLKANKNNGRIVTRFPPEPNGYLHIGHAKSICLNFGIAAEHEGGICNLRFDDTDPVKEDIEYVESIKKGSAYICSLSAEEIRKYSGTLTETGKDSPWRNRSIEENLDMFERVIKDKQTGKVVELRCTYDPETKGGWSSDGRKVRGTLHWVSASHSIKAEVRLYDRQFIKENPTEGKDNADFMNCLNPNSLEILTSCRVEPSLASAKPESRYQFERLGYFCVDSVDSHEGGLVFNRTATLRDSWAKIEKKERKKEAK